MAYSPPKIATDGFRSSVQWQGGERNSVGRRAASVGLLCLVALWLPLTALAARTCDEWQADVVSVEGRVEIQTAEGWQAADDGAKICTGYAVRVHRFSRAAIRLPDKTMLRLDQDTSLTFSEPRDDTGTWLDVLRGIIHVISRDPRALRFNTPYANAGLEGTEFVIRVNDEQTDVTVLEGEVLLSNAAGAIGVPNGQRGSARFSQAPTTEPVSDTVDAVHWTPYYVAILGERLPAADQVPRPAEAQTAEFYSHRAARRLSVGRVAEAQDDLDHSLSLDPKHAEGFALRVLIALADQNLTQALHLAERVTALAPDSPAAWLALSYAAEADFDLQWALTSASTAMNLAPEDGFARARLAELQLATGNHRGARETAEIASALSPELAHARTVLGFARLSGRSTEAATIFREAIALDPAAPLPRLGLGLALVRQGDLDAGREQIEIAVVLDPTNTMSRSYMAKFYEAERRGELSESQLVLAKVLGTEDPTPWFYDALRKQSENRPVEALRDLHTAVDLNDNRAVYRSRLMLDEDLTARSAGVGRLHNALGFEQLALLGGWKSAAADPADYSGHRLLSDVYSYLPRHQIARVNELFQSQLLQPLNMTPIRPQLAEANLFILDTVGPSTLAFDEFQPLVRGNGLSYQGSAVAAGNGTRGADVAVAGLHDRVSYSVGRFEFETDGFRPNNDFDQEVTNAFLQFRPDHDTSVLTELRSSVTEKGDIGLLFDPTAFSGLARQEESVDSLRVGLRRTLSGGGTFLASIVSEDVDVSLGFGDVYSQAGNRSGYTVDAQHLYNVGRWHLTVGGKYLDQTQRDIIETTLDPAAPPFEAEYAQEARHDLTVEKIYAYGNVHVHDNLVVLLGASVDRVAGQGVDRAAVNPKVGLIWDASPRMTLRAAAFRTLQGPLVSKHNIQPSLEPTHVVGFNQQFFGSEGEEAWRYGVGLDYRISTGLLGGIELSRRDLEVPISLVPSGSSSPSIHFPSVQESWRRGYLYWMPTEHLSASAAYQYENFDNGGFSFSDGLTQVRTHRLPIELNYFHGSGFTAGATATYVDQAGDFSPMSFGPDAFTERGEDRFWVMDLSLGYRLQSRRGQVSLNVRNALDQDFRFQDTDPENPRLLPERMVLMKVTLSY